MSKYGLRKIWYFYLNYKNMPNLIVFGTKHILFIPYSFTRNFRLFKNTLTVFFGNTPEAFRFNLLNICIKYLFI